MTLENSNSAFNKLIQNFRKNLKTRYKTLLVTIETLKDSDLTIGDRISPYLKLLISNSNLAITISQNIMVANSGPP